MITFLADIFPKIQRYSEKLDNLTLLTNQHWVSIDNILSNKIVYIFRSNNELLISTNGKVEKAKWEYIGNKSLLIDKKTDSYLFKHGFFDENILALKVDSSEEYAVFVNENKYDGELNSIERVMTFLNDKYLSAQNMPSINDSSISNIVELRNNESKIGAAKKRNSAFYSEFNTDKGIIYIRLDSENALPVINNGVYQFGSIAKTGKYKLGDRNYIIVDGGVIVDFTPS
ncbi:MAG: hypothetical protein ACK5Z2_00915 [Bacteroidota bacterium]|jgi:hypothetical protein